MKYGKNAVINIIASNSALIKNYGINKIDLFGSFVRDKANSNSDIDFLVEFQKDKKNYKNFIRLAYYLESLLGREVELVTPKSISQFIKPYIMDEIEYIQINA